MLKIWNNYYLDANRVCYTLKKAHTKADGGVEYNICTYHTRLEEALAEAVRRTIREGVASESAVLVLMFVLMRQSVFHNLLWKDTFSYNKTLRAIPLESLFSFMV